MKKRFSEEQIIGFLREAEAGLAVKDLCRRHGFSEASYYLWRAKFGVMSVPDAKRLKRIAGPALPMAGRSDTTRARRHARHAQSSLIVDLRPTMKDDRDPLPPMAN